MTPEYRLRQGTPADARLVVAQRQAMFVDMGEPDDAKMAEMSRRFLPWVEELLATGAYRAWFIEHDGHPVAGAGLWMKEGQPGLRSPFAFVPYVLNVYCHPEHRGRGLARQLMEAIVGACRDEGMSVVELHASEFGRHLYETMGFKATNEMRLKFE